MSFFRCWLIPYAFYSAFLAPVMLILIWNFVCFALVLRVIWGVHAKKLNKTVRNKTTSRLRGILSVMTLLGLTWVFAIFSMKGGGLAFQYLFSIFNSLQGFFVFVFYCACNKEVRNRWKMRIPFYSDEYSPSQTRSKGKISLLFLYNLKFD